MGLLSSIGGFFGGPVGGLLGSAGDYFLGKNDAAEGSSAQQAMSRGLRQTAYQDTVYDLKKAGLNPMMAFSNGATNTPMPTLNNRGLSAAQQSQSNSATSVNDAQKDNIKADTTNKLAQAEQIAAQTALLKAQEANTTSSTGQIQATTENIKATLPKIQEEVRLVARQWRNEEERIFLTKAQKELTDIQQKLTTGQLSNVEAQTRTQNVLTDLRKLDIPGAKNVADYEEALSTGAGNAASIAGKIMDKIPAAGRLKGLLGNSAKRIAK